MNCQNCDAPVLASDERCEKCGAKLLHRKFFPNSPRPEEFVLTAEEPPMETKEARAEEESWQFPARAELVPAPPQTEAPRDSRVEEVRWGGFFRRAGAGLIDLAVIALLSALMGVTAYIGYKVGLTAHQRPISWNRAAPLISYLTFAWIALASAYFVVFHGMAGKTVGKWLLGLRVVGTEQSPISYRRALLRWVGTVGFGAASFGLSLLWVLWQREKRAWHDFLAGTWVIRG
jgi:uncharacterized RDD family membrane protein YckC